MVVGSGLILGLFSLSLSSKVFLFGCGESLGNEKKGNFLYDLLNFHNNQIGLIIASLHLVRLICKKLC